MSEDIVSAISTQSAQIEDIDLPCRLPQPEILKRGFPGIQDLNINYDVDWTKIVATATMMLILFWIIFLIPNSISEDPPWYL